MKVRYCIFIIFALTILTCISYADRDLDRDEILNIFQELTEQPKTSWIEEGFIQATHRELERATGFTVESEESVSYDGERFIWRINANSRTKKVQDANNQQVILEDRVNFNFSKERIFSWDGNNYTLYFASGKHAVIYEDTSDIPVGVNGPLTAGVIPWGIGNFSYDNLITMDSSAREIENGDEQQVRLVLDKEDSPHIELILDPSKNYALLSCLVVYERGDYSIRTYNNYINVNEIWIPTYITIERYNNQQKLMSHDNWQITSVSPTIKDSFNFGINLEKGTSVKYFAAGFDKPFSYKHNDSVESGYLLQKKMELECSSEEDRNIHNCATVAAKFVTDSMNIPVDIQRLSSIKQGIEGQTNLYDLKALLEDKGLYCKAVKGCDVRTLGDMLSNCKVILYLPGQMHYVVLAGIDDEYAWILDLNERYFLYNKELDKLNEAIEPGACLIISDEALQLDEGFIQIEDENLNQYYGGQTGSCCTDLIREGGHETCEEYEGTTSIVTCLSTYTFFYDLYKCEACEGSSECYGEPQLSYRWCLCYENLENPQNCTISYDFKESYARGCPDGS